MDNSEDRLLQLAAARCRATPGFLGYTLSQYQQLTDINDQELADELDCDQRQLAQLAVCRIPRDGRLSADVKQIAERVQINQLGLLRLIRLHDSLTVLSTDSDMMQVLQAARRIPDRSNDDEEAF